MSRNSIKMILFANLSVAMKNKEALSHAKRNLEVTHLVFLSWIFKPAERNTRHYNILLFSRR